MSRQHLAEPSPTHYRLTEHARKRKVQRGINDLQVELIRIFGDDHYQKGGATLSFISDKRITQLRAALDRCSGKALIKGDQEDVITAMQMTRKVSCTEWST